MSLTNVANESDYFRVDFFSDPNLSDALIPKLKERIYQRLLKRLGNGSRGEFQISSIYPDGRFIYVIFERLTGVRTEHRATDELFLRTIEDYVINYRTIDPIPDDEEEDARDAVVVGRTDETGTRIYIVSTDEIGNSLEGTLGGPAERA